MSDTTNSSQISNRGSNKKSGGGIAIGGGVSFQAITTAIVAVHILRGTPLGWLDGIFDDIPLAVWAESEGPGDDIRIEFKENIVGEVQVKKGLRRGQELWESLETMAKAIVQNKINYAVLVVASDSSSTIQKNLADDIKRLGQGRSDHLTDIGDDWKERLFKLNIASNSVCSYMRVRVIYGLSHADTNILLAKEALRYVCMDNKDVEKAWDALYRHSVQLMEHRGRWELKDLLQILSSINIRIRDDNFPASVLSYQTEWVKENNSYFFITGVKSKISIKHLLPMKVEKIPFNSFHAIDMPTALSNYQKNAELEFSSSLDGYDSVWLGRFIKHAVVVAGPGLGKSTMLKELAHQYAEDGYFVLKVDLRRIAARLKNGESFRDSLISLALDGAKVNSKKMSGIPLSSWVILADGLDECGDSIHDVAQQISHFLQGHSAVRIIITTRPIGYSTAEFESWTHYRLLPPIKEQGVKNLAHFMTVIAQKNSVEEEDKIIAERELHHSLKTEAFAMSPQLLGMAASLIHRNKSLPNSRTQLYQQLISLFDDIPKEQDDSQQDVYDLVINIVGWTLIKNPFIESKELIKVCTGMIAPEIGKTKYDASIIVRNSLKHWERFGLIEQINYQSSSLITFIHKTFSEFMAARFLYENHEEYLEEIIDKAEWTEIINFAIGIGLADEVIKIKLQHHSLGKSGSLSDAISLYSKNSIYVSDFVAKELIEQAVLVIKSGGEERFILGVALSNLVSMLPKANTQVADILIPTISSWIDMPNNDLYLIGWGIVVKSLDQNFDAEVLSNTLKNAKSNVTIPSIIQTITEKRDRSDRELLERIALATLRSQPDEKIAEFYYSELKGQGFLTFGTAMACEVILKERGVELEESLLSKFNLSKQLTRTVGLFNSETIESWNVYYAIAKAIVNGHNNSFTPQKKGKFPNFAGLLSASGMLDIPVTFVYDFDVKYEERAFSSIIKSIIELLPLDLYALQNEAIELINIIENDPSTRVLALLPRVDVIGVEWEKSTGININKDHMKKMLFHPSKYIGSLAMNLLIYHPFSKDELVLLLTKADGFTLATIFLLADAYYPNDSFEMIASYLESHTPVDPTDLFAILQSIKKIPSQMLVDKVMMSISSDNKKVVVSVANLLRHWVSLGITIHLALINKTIEYWQSQGDSSKNIYFSNALTELIELRDQITGTLI